MNYTGQMKAVSKSFHYKEIVKLIACFNGSDITEYYKKQESAIKKEKAKQAKLRLAKIAQGEKDFMDYKIDYIYIGNDYDLIRVSQCGKFIETSQRIQINIESAKTLYKLIQNNIDIVGRKIEGYEVLAINGVLTIGCHRIKNFREIGELISK